ncbi:MAG: helix-hairpin-helix domain-containing protein [Sphingomonas sp.]
MTAPLYDGAPVWLTLSFVLIAAGVVVALLILWWGARLAGRRRRTERTLVERGEVDYSDDAPDYGRSITPPASPLPPGPPEVFDEPLPPTPEPAPVAEPEPAPEAPAPEPEPVEHHAEPIEGAPAREPEPAPEAEVPNPAAEPLDAGPAGEAGALAEPVVAAEGETAPEPLAAEPAPPPPADDLTRMKGVGPRLAERLNTVGIASFAQIAALSPEEAAALDAKLGDFQGRLERDRWIDQARFLAAGDIAGFEETFGRL